jgi:hypothetical protein
MSRATKHRVVELLAKVRGGLVDVVRGRRDDHLIDTQPPSMKCTSHWTERYRQGVTGESSQAFMMPNNSWTTTSILVEFSHHALPA